MSRTRAAVLAWLLLPLAAAGGEGDRLTVTGSLVNLRGGPTQDAPVLLRFKQGRSLVELERRGDWVRVDTGREDVRTGWIYEDLIRVEMDADGAAQDDDPDTVADLVDLFRRALDEYNSRKNRKAGFAYFIEPEYAGNGVIVVTGTKPWLQRPMEQRMEDLNEVFEIWAAAVGEGPSITINVVNPAGEKQMTMYR